MYAIHLLRSRMHTNRQNICPQPYSRKENRPRIQRPPISPNPILLHLPPQELGPRIIEAHALPLHDLQDLPFRIRVESGSGILWVGDVAGEVEAVR